MPSPTDLLLVPMGLPEAGLLLPWLGPRLERVFHASCRTVETELDIRQSYSAARSQYDTRSLLSALAALSDSGLVLGVTGQDLFVPIFTFVIGEAQLGGRAALVSTFRLSEGPSGLSVRPEVLRARLLKEAVHELGHCQGLLHCLEPRCVMHASSTADDVDLKSDQLCDRCLLALRARQSPAARRA